MAVATTRDEGRAAIAALVCAFKSNEADHKATGYNETQARTDFISPMLEAFGWDVHNTLRQPIGLREVFEEATVEVGPEKLSKKPDYEIRLARQRKMFVEAKKPSVNIERDINAAFQTRRYGFSGSLPISILTNFAQIAVYDCRPVPSAGDNANIARIKIINCEDYEQEFDSLWDMFSREAVYSGDFDKQFSVGVTRFGSEQFDDIFLAQVRDWRERLAIEIHRNRPDLKPVELTYVVQLLISRIVFLRICEDREIEAYESLLKLKVEGTYDSFKKILKKADSFYNSGLFRLIEDDPLSVQVGDTVLQSILDELYYPRSPYTFAVVEPEVLGEIYEIFLGEEIIVDGDTVNIVYKPEVREAGGVVPTPRFVVDSIIDRTLRPALHGRGPKDLENFTVADLCCGSGIFLLSAYDTLLNHYLAWYLDNGRQEHVGKRIYEVAGGQWRLAFSERRRILETHIRGVDIDDNAVEIARFSLLLKLIENETRADLEDFVQRMRAPALPSLEIGLRSGNSLVSHSEWDDFIETYKPSEVSSPISLKPHDFFASSGETPDNLNPFTWETEFPGDMASGGFDVIVGNPPYTRIQVMQRYFPEEMKFYVKKYATAERLNFDKYAVFVEKYFKLIKPHGKIGVIIPHKFMSTMSGAPLRAMFSAHNCLEYVSHFGAQQIFGDVANYTCILITDQKGRADLTLERVIDVDRWRYGQPGILARISAATLSGEPWEMADPAAMAVFQRMRASHPKRLGTIAEVFVGLQTSKDVVYSVRPVEETATHVIVVWAGKKWPIEKGILLPFLQDVQLTSFKRAVANRWLIFPYENYQGRQRLIQPNDFKNKFPDCWNYLFARKKELESRNVSGGLAEERQWYQFGRSQSLGKFDAEKIIVQVLSLEARYAYDDARSLFTGGGNGPFYGIRSLEGEDIQLRYILAVLSHPLSEAMIRTRTSVFRGGYYSHGKQFLDVLPMPDPGVAERTRISNLVADLTDKFDQCAALRLPADRERKNREIIHLRDRIEKAVTAAFGLSPEEFDTVKAVPIPN